MTSAAPGPSPAPYDVFFSYNWADKPAIRKFDDSLGKAGVNVCVDYRHLKPGGRWISELPQAIHSSAAVMVFYGREGYGKTQTKEIELSVAANKRIIPVILPDVPGNQEPPLDFVSLHTWLDLRHESIDRLIDLLKPNGSNSAASTPSAANPYKGLAFFREEDASFFFGRTQKTAELKSQLLRYRFVAITGPSGNGKSSLLRAGLSHSLRKSGEEWEILNMVPNRDPWLELARALAPVLYPTEDPAEKARHMAGLLSSGHMQLRDYARELERRHGQQQQLLLIVDQFEELYTLSESPAGPFIDQLLDAPPLHVAVAYRGDFHDRVTGHNALAERLNQSATFNLPPMLPADLRTAIAEPARMLGRPIDAAVIDRILQDAGEEPGTLPLMEFVLRQLWETREMDLDAYHSLGELHGALARHADGVFERLTEPEREAARRIFLQVVRPGEAGATDTRRRAAKFEIGDDDWRVAGKLSNHPCRLLVSSSVNGVDSVEVSHEALIRSWKRLKGWLDADREFLLWRERLRLHVEEWRANPHEDALLRGPQLAEAERWVAHPDLSEGARAYIQSSTRHAAEIAKRRHQATRRLQALAAVLAIALLGVLYFFAEARHQRAVAEKARAKSQDLVDFLVFELRDTLAPYVPSARRAEINQRISDYQNSNGSGDDDNRERARGVQFNTAGNTHLARGDLSAALASYQAGLAISAALARKDPLNFNWQRDLLVSHSKIGRVQESQGDLTSALISYQASLRIAESLTRKDRTNALWQRDLSVTYNKLGGIQQAQGNLTEALASYQMGIAIAEVLVRKNPASTESLRDLSVSHNKIGDVQKAQNRLKDALASYQSGFNIAEALARKDPANTEWQRDLSINYDSIGGVMRAEGKLNEALASYRSRHTLALTLATKDPGNTEWQRDLSISYGRIGDIQQAQGYAKAALLSQQASLALAETLAFKDPANTQWQRDLSVSHEKIGDIQQAQRDTKAALVSYQACLAIRETLARKDPANTDWQRDLFYGHWKFANALLSKGKSADARPHAKEALAIAESLTHHDPSNATWKQDLESARALMKRID